MEVQAFKMRVSQDNKVRDSFAPEYHLRQNSNNTTRLNDDGNDSGINDHLTSARFNFPEEIEDQNANDQNQINHENQNLPNTQQQSFQMQKQQHLTAYQKKNLELNDYSSNGKHNLNSNGNYNTQRTNQSNQTLSESNTVVKEKQPEELLANEEEECDGEHFQNGNQAANQYDKYQQQNHYNQLVLHHQQIQQKQLYQKQNGHLNCAPQQKRLQYDVQNNQQQGEELVEQHYIHNQSQNSMNQVDIDFLGEENQIAIQQSIGNSGYSRQITHSQNQNKYQNQLLQKQQQNIMNQQVKRQISNNNSMQQSFGMFNQYDQNQQQQQQQQLLQFKQNKNVYQQPNGGQFFNHGEVDECEQYDYEQGHLQDYNNDPYLQNGQYLSNLQQKQQNYNNALQLQYNQKIYQYPTQQINHNNSILNQQKQQQLTALQQLKQSNQENLNYGSQSLNGKIQAGQGIKNYMHKRNASQLNYSQRQCHTYSDDEVLTLTQGEEDDRHILLQDNQEKVQNQLSSSRSSNNNNQQNKIGFNAQGSYHGCYSLSNPNLQKIDKQTIDEHSNNTSNNEEGIVNISSIKKNVITNQNTPSHANYQNLTSPIPLKESNNINNQQSNIKSQFDQNQGINYYQKSIVNQNTNQQSRKNNFIEDKENQTPHNSLSVNKNQRENSANFQKGYGTLNKNQNSLSPLSVTPYNQSLQNSCNQSYLKGDKDEKLKLNNQKQKLDISADENIQDTSYSMFLPGANYLDEELYLQNNSMIKQNSKNWKNNQNVNQKPYHQNQQQKQHQQQNPSQSQDTSQRFTEEQLDCSQLNIKDLQDGYYCEAQDKISSYYQDEQNRKISQTKIQNQSLITSKIENNSSLNKKPVINSTAANKSSQNKNINKTTNSTSATQSTSITFQTQGFPRDSIGSKENIYNIQNLTSEGKNLNTQENKSKSQLNNQKKLNTEGDLEHIDFDQAVEQQVISNQANNHEINQRAIKAVASNENKQKMKTIGSRSNSQESQNENDGSKLELDKSRQIFQDQHKEYKKIYDILNYERNKNEAQEKLIRQKSQMVFDYQKVIEQIRKENEQLKQEREEKNITILSQKKYIQELEEQQKNNKEQELNEELMQENEKLNEQYKNLQNEYKEFLDQNIQLINENKQLIKYNNELENSLNELQSKHIVLDESVQMSFQNQISQLQLEIEKITATKDQEIESLKKSIFEISTQSQQYHGRKYSIHSQDQQQAQLAKKLEKGTSSESMNISSAMTDNSFSQSFHGHPPRKQQNSLHIKNQQSNVQPSHNISSNSHKNSNSNNYNTIYSHASQDESNLYYQSQNLQNYRRARSSSLSSKGLDQSLQNSYYVQNNNNISQSQSNHHHSGSFSQSSQSIHSNQNNSHINPSQSSGISQQQNQIVNSFSVSELLRLLSLSSEQEILQKVKDIQEYNTNTKKFINCIIDMIQKCAPQGYFTNKKPDLKQCWNILKKIMDKYLVLKVNMIKDQVDSELIIKIQSYLQTNEKEQIIEKITNLQSENQKLTRIIILVKKTFNLEWAKSHYELEKALENECDQQIAQTSKSFSGLKQDNLPSHSSQITFNGYSQLSSAHQINSKGSVSNLQNINNINSQISHFRGMHKKEAINNQDHNQQQLLNQQQLYGSAASSQRIDSANSNHIVHHNLLI